MSEAAVEIPEINFDDEETQKKRGSRGGTSYLDWEAFGEFTLSLFRFRYVPKDEKIPCPKFTATFAVVASNNDLAPVGYTFNYDFPLFKYTGWQAGKENAKAIQFIQSLVRRTDDMTSDELNKALRKFHGFHNEDPAKARVRLARHRGNSKEVLKTDSNGNAIKDANGAPKLITKTFCNDYFDPAP